MTRNTLATRTAFTLAGLVTGVLLTYACAGNGQPSPAIADTGTSSATPCRTWKVKHFYVGGDNALEFQLPDNYEPLNADGDAYKLLTVEARTCIAY